MAGEYYNCHDKVFTGFKAAARKLLAEYNALSYEQKEEKAAVLKRHRNKCIRCIAVYLRLRAEYFSRQQRIRQYELHIRGLQYDNHRK